MRTGSLRGRVRAASRAPPNAEGPEQPRAAHASALAPVDAAGDFAERPASLAAEPNDDVTEREAQVRMRQRAAPAARDDVSHGGIRVGLVAVDASEAGAQAETRAREPRTA